MSWLLPEYRAELDLSVCKGRHPSQQCRYLDDSTQRCLKLDPELSYVIDIEVELFLTKGTAHKGDAMLPLGDNCPGVKYE